MFELEEKQITAGLRTYTAVDRPIVIQHDVWPDYIPHPSQKFSDFDDYHMTRPDRGWDARALPVSPVAIPLILLNGWICL